MSHYFSGSERWHRVSYSDRCDGCGGSHGCSYVVKGGRKTTCCVRNRETPKLARDGRGLHYSENAVAVILEPPRPLPASIQRRHAVYTAMLDRLTLESRERQTLLDRGLNTAQIDTLGYKTTRDVAEELVQSGQILDRVPGFFRENGVWRANLRAGIFVSMRDAAGRISGIQMRTYDERVRYKWFSSFARVLPDGTKELLPYGASSGCPVSHHTGSGTMVWITEGSIKSDILALLTGYPVLGKAGTDAGLEDVARACLKFETAVLCYDMDWQTNKFVRNALVRQARAIEQRTGIPVKIALWDESFKGVDDFLLAGGTKMLVTDFWKAVK